jgi:integrase
LTGCRLNEVAGMRRSELSDDGTVWTIPGERTKNRRTHVVPLPPMARTLIATASTAGDLVFTTDGAHPVAIGSKIKRRLDAKMKLLKLFEGANGHPAKAIEELKRWASSPKGKAAIADRTLDGKILSWRVHDLRRTCATGMAEIGIAPHIVEAALNHVSGAKAGVAGTYNRAAYAPEKKAALGRWAAHIEHLLSGKPAKVVVPLHRAEA